MVITVDVKDIRYIVNYLNEVPDSDSHSKWLLYKVWQGMAYMGNGNLYAFSLVLHLFADQGADRLRTYTG